MFREHLIPHGFVTQLHFPPLNHSTQALREFFMGVSERFQYKQFEILPQQGAVLKDGEARCCEIGRDRFVLREQPTSATLEEYAQQLTHMATEVQEKLRIPLWVFQNTVVRFLVPLDEHAGPLMRNQIFNLSEEALECFGRPVLGLCMRVEFPPVPEDNSQIQLRLEPYFRDPKKLFLEVGTRFLQPLQKVDEIRFRIKGMEEFVKEKALSFLEQSLTRQDS